MKYVEISTRMDEHQTKIGTSKYFRWATSAGFTLER